MSTPPAAPRVTAQEAREVAEAARETEWTRPSFVAGLFDGRLRMDRIHPHPVPDPADEAAAAPFFAALQRAMDEHLDPDAVDRTRTLPPAFIQALKDIGAFGIKIPKEYGGLGLSQLSYIRAMEI
ncbi:MAG: acyl-CoA dehydrogenase family protein, partial [Gemmatimonadales bacterium]